MLFIIAIDPLKRLLDRASDRGLLRPIERRATKMRISMYVDDTAISVRLDARELQVFPEILSLFGRASGLENNNLKPQAFTIACGDMNLEEVPASFPCQRKEFP